MSSSDAQTVWPRRAMLRAALAAPLLALALGLGACTSFAPVYGDIAQPGTAAVAYAEPTNRLEQIVYQDLALRLGRTTDQSAPRLTVSTTRADRRLARSRTDNPREQFEAVVTGAITLTGPTGEVLFTGTRSAAALYDAGDQILADVTAEAEAGERAARALAETIRLTLLGVLADRP